MLKRLASLLLVLCSAQSFATSPNDIEALLSTETVAVPPCRFIDTHVSHPREQAAAVSADVRATRCAVLLPRNTEAIKLRVTTYRWQNRPDPTAPPETIEMTLPVAAAVSRTFAVPPGTHLAVDLIGYVAPSASQGTQHVSATIATRSDSAIRAAEAGTGGDVNVGGQVPGYPNTGVFMRSNMPWIRAKVGSSADTTGFAIHDVLDKELMRLQSNGLLQLADSASFAGRTDYFGTAARIVPANRIFQANLTDPLDSAGGSANRLYMFLANTASETGSPAITKFHAFTLGNNNQANINFDSFFHSHKTNQYHYRAFSWVEQKDTFWVKPAGLSELTGTRSDMYLSGDLGIGATPAASLIESNVTPTNGGRILRMQAVQPVIALKSTNAAQESSLTTNAYGLFLSVAGNPTPQDNAIIFRVGTTANSYVVSEKARINPTGLQVTGDITATGMLGAKYQDVAEWVPATEPIADGTVVVLDASSIGGVKASSKAYDSSVAGVISPQPGLLLGEAGEGKVKVATTGRVKVRVDATKHPIEVGDLLASSETPGVAMKSTPLDLGGVPIHRPGTILGKAIEPLASGTGEIIVLLSLQ